MSCGRRAWVVGAVVAEGEFIGATTHGESQDLMPETNAEEGKASQ